jgi:hypothetical protein
MTGRRYTSAMTTDPGTTTTKEDSMRTLLPRAGRRVLLASAAVIALAAAGIAVADSGSPATFTLVSASFSANTLVKSQSETCTPAAPADAFTTTDAVFTGTASGATDPRLNGPITIHVRSIYDTTKSMGTLQGDVTIQNSTPPGQFHARLSAVNANGNVQGWLDGRLGDGSHFMGSFTSTFALTGSTVGFSSGTIGANPAAANNSAIIGNGHCEQPHPNPPASGPHHDKGNENDQGDDQGGGQGGGHHH